MEGKSNDKSANLDNTLPCRLGAVLFTETQREQGRERRETEREWRGTGEIPVGRKNTDFSSMGDVQQASWPIKPWSVTIDSVDS